jgi:proline iminopeptidase
VLGDGPSWVVWPGACYVEADLDRLLPGRRLLLYDQRARGRSDAVDDPARIGIDRDLDDLEDVVRQVGLRRYALVGWSYVGAVAALYAAAHPDEVERVVLMCPIPPRRGQYPDALPREAIDARVDPAALERLTEMERSGEAERDPIAFCRAHLRTHRPRQMGDPTGLERMRTDPCVFPNEWPRNREAAMPALVLHGSADPIPLSGSREWAAEMRDARLLVLEGSGHFPHLERPAAFFPALDAFLRGIWPDGAERVS